MNTLAASQIIHAVFILLLFVGYGILVRRGAITGKAILGFGALVTVLAVASASLAQVPLLRAGAISLPLFFFHPVLMALVSVFCVLFSYRSQQVEDLATLTVGDTKIIVRFCPPTLIPDVDALLLPTSSTLRMTDGLALFVGMGAGAEPAQEALAHAPVGLGKVVATGPGRLAVGRIYHVAVCDPFKAVNDMKLRRGLESAAQQARKGNAESVAVPVGLMRGINLADSVEAIVSGVLKQRKAFAEVVFIVFEPRMKKSIVQEIVRVVGVMEPGSPSPSSLR